MTKFIERHPVWALRHPDRGRGSAVAGFCDLAARAGGRLRQEEGVPQRRFQRHHARRPVFPGGERLHPDLRADAQRQSRARLALSVRRLYRLCGERCDRILDAELHRRFRRRRAGRRRHADPRLPPHRGAGPAPDHGDDRAVDRVCRPDAVGLRRRLLSDSDAARAGWPDRIAVRHRGQIVGRGGLSAVSDGATGHLRGVRRDRRRDVARAQPHAHRHDRARRRRRSRHSGGDGRAASSWCSSWCSRSVPV